MLTVSILTESDVGVYRCEVTNSAGLSGSNSTTIKLGSEYYNKCLTFTSATVDNRIVGFHKLDLQEDDYTSLV